MNSEEFDTFVLKQAKHVQREIKLLPRNLGKDPRVGDKHAREKKNNLQELQGKLDTINWSTRHTWTVLPQSSLLKAMTFDSSW